jgi:hypothetical protein
MSETTVQSTLFSASMEEVDSSPQPAEDSQSTTHNLVCLV